MRRKSEICLCHGMSCFWLHTGAEYGIRGDSLRCIGMTKGFSLESSPNPAWNADKKYVS